MTITIDGRLVECPEGRTILAVARGIGIDIPTLCHVEGFAPGVSCMVCVVKVVGVERLLPACATLAADGQVIDTRAPEVVESRRMALELLLSDHVGDCEGPCRMTCPAAMDIPEMLRHIGRNRWDAAWRVASDGLLLPETLGHVCPGPCEKVCRRARHDAAVAIRALHREAARRQRATGAAPLPSAAAVAPSGRRVAIVGAGPAGLAALYELARLGHACTLMESQDAAGGALRAALDDAALPRTVLDAETRAIVALPGVTVQWRTPLRDAAHLAELAESHDAVVLAFGHHPGLSTALGLRTTAHGLQTDPHTGRTSNQTVFAAGGAVTPIRKLAVRAVATGRQTARAVDRMLNGRPLHPERPMLNVRLKTVTDEEMALLSKGAHPATRMATTGSDRPGDAMAAVEAARCMRCDCRAARDCGLRRLSHEYGASPRGFDGPRREMSVDDSHDELIYESGKCVNCGLCLQVSERRGERYGLAFVKRGFAARMAPALGRALRDAIHSHAADYATICPTGALRHK